MNTVYRLVKHKGVTCPLTDSKAFFVGETGLFDIDIYIAHALDDTSGFVHQPTRIRIRDEDVSGFHQFGNRSDTFNIGVRIAADFQLEFAVSFRTIGGDLCCHLVGRLLRNRAIQHEICSIPSAEKRTDRLV